MLFGALDYSMRIWLDPDKLTNLRLTPAEVAAAIQSQNVQAAVGRIGAAPVSRDQQFQLTITTQGRLTSPEEFENIVVRANPDGRSEEHTSELQSLMRISYAVFCLKKKTTNNTSTQ